MNGKDLLDPKFLIDEIIVSNIQILDEYDTINEFLDAIRVSLEDGQYISSLGTDEDTVNEAYRMLENNEYKIDKGLILEHFIDRSKVKKGAIYDFLDISNSTFLRKVANNFNFNHNELLKLKEILKLNDTDFMKLF